MHGFFYENTSRVKFIYITHRNLKLIRDDVTLPVSTVV